MPKPLSKEWIGEQLALCAKATEDPWMQGWEGQQWPMARRCITSVSTGKAIILGGTDRHGYNPTGLQQQKEDGAFIIAAREGYPLVLQALLNCQNVVRESLRGFGSIPEEAADGSET
jgi:hypothetical protein